MPSELTQLAVLFSVAAVLGLIATLIRQPLILAWLLGGVLISWFGWAPAVTSPLFQLFSQLGIMFLLFLVGLEINVSSLRHVGAPAMVLGLGQIIFTAVGGFILAILLGFATAPGAYLAIALTFSSTIIVVKLLSEKRDINSLYGKLAIGLLLVQDFVAIMALMILAGIGHDHVVSSGAVVWTMAKGVALFAIMAWLGRQVLPKIFDRISRTPELVFVLSLAWLFTVATATNGLGLSIEIGGFLAGLSLANSAEHFQIASRIKPLRDFFLLLFFFLLGSSISIAHISGLVWPILALSCFVLIGNPIIVMVILGSMGYHRRTGFMAGVAVAQISEFSLVLVTLGLRLGHISSDIVTIVTAVGAITIAISSFMILHADALYIRLERWLQVFERRQPKSNRRLSGPLTAPIILLGAHRTGQNILSHLARRQVVVIDFDPDVVMDLKRRGIKALFGDMTDPDLFEAVDFSRATLIISTSPDTASTSYFLAELARRLPSRQRPVMIVRAETLPEADEFYRSGASYVMLPAYESGLHLGRLLRQNSPAKILQELRRHNQSVQRPLSKHS